MISRYSKIASAIFPFPKSLMRPSLVISKWTHYNFDEPEPIISRFVSHAYRSITRRTRTRPIHGQPMSPNGTLHFSDRKSTANATAADRCGIEQTILSGGINPWSLSRISHRVPDSCRWIVYSANRVQLWPKCESHSRLTTENARFSTNCSVIGYSLIREQIINH